MGSALRVVFFIRNGKSTRFWFHVFMPLKATKELCLACMQQQCSCCLLYSPSSGSVARLSLALPNPTHARWTRNQNLALAQHHALAFSFGYSYKTLLEFRNLLRNNSGRTMPTPLHIFLSQPQNHTAPSSLGTFDAEPVAGVEDCQGRQGLPRQEHTTASLTTPKI